MSANPYGLPGIEVEFPPAGEALPMAWQVAIKDEAGEPINTITELHIHLHPNSLITATARKLDEDDPEHDSLVEYAVAKVSFR